MESAKQPTWKNEALENGKTARRKTRGGPLFKVLLLLRKRAECITMMTAAGMRPFGFR